MDQIQPFCKCGIYAPETCASKCKAENPHAVYVADLNPVPQPVLGDELIAQERDSQVMKHHRSILSDAQYNSKGQLLVMANAILTNIYIVPEGWRDAAVKRIFCNSWPDRLTIAGALIAAEIDRINFMREMQKNNGNNI